MKRLLFLCTFLLALAASSFASLQATATITYTQSGSNYTYHITLNNTGTTTVGTFFFAWIPGEDFLKTNPSSVQSPANWTETIFHSGVTDGYGIDWTTSVKLQAGQSLSGFSFTTTDTPAQVFGNSVYYTSTPVCTSFVYIGALFGDPGYQFVAQPLAEPTSVVLGAAAVTGGNGVRGTVTLSQKVTANTNVALSSDNAAAIVPATVTVASGTNTGTFAVTSNGVDAATTAHIKATLNGISQSATLTLNPASLSTETIRPASVYGMQVAQGIAWFNGKTSSDTKTVTLASSNTNAATVPSSAPVAKQSFTSGFLITAKDVMSDTSTIITVTYNGVSKTATLPVLALAHATGTVAYTSVAGVYTYTVTLTNTGTKGISTFWMSWIPGKNLLPLAPTSILQPTGWSHTLTHGTGDGYGIQFTTTTPLAAGKSLSGFKFSTTATPTQILGNSPFDSAVKVLTSYVYIGAPFTDPGFRFVIT